ncbi:MAG: tRNA (adenosine(37)-N6)-dimethylallyltransferase MiaA [Bacteroidota bacterium]|nr:tRNA (adenosine(37)-N6)-dimethylallyltransferase MiaA [Bacteroidota bacterium]
MKNILIVIVGPTGVGKTTVSVEIAAHFGTEIISADSRQFYREMIIGTAVPSEDQLNRVRHHFIRFLSVNEYFSASLYERAVLELLPSVFAVHRVAVMTGGSGMYVDAVCNGIDDIPDIDPAIREKYNSRCKNEGIEGLRTELKLLDPEHYARIDLQNPKRIIRALEIIESTGRPYSSFLTRKKVERNFGIIKIGLQKPRAELYKEIDSRVDSMINNGLEEETQNLLQYKHLNPLRTVGYREFFDFFEGKVSRAKAIELIKRNSRRYAKRQMTWWSRDHEIRWFSPDNVGKIISFIEEVIKS